MNATTDRFRFRAGDMVIVTDSEMYPGLNGAVGNVVLVDDGCVGVDFGEPYYLDYAFHNLGGRLPRSTGWHLPSSDVRLYDADVETQPLSDDEVDAFLCTVI